ncbi:MAG: response regulator [Marinobacter sp.]|nr:response regulator [Marinobacter sp.]
MNRLDKVLYVEDDPDIREIAAMALEDVGGFTLKTCESGEEALREVEAFAPQMILLDVMMPGMDGTETLAALRQQGSISPSTLAVFMTAKVHPEELQRYKTMGVENVISKPFDPMTLADEIQKIWETSNG